VTGRRKDYYPQYYLAKRNRERMVLAGTVVFLAVVVVGLVVLAVVYFTKPRADLEQLAEAQPEIVAPEPEKTAQPAPPVAPSPVDRQELLALEDVEEYAESVPELSLMPADIAPGAEPAAAEEVPPPQVAEEVMLFNLDDDLGEQEDLAAARPEIVKALRAALAAWEADVDRDRARAVNV